MIVRASISRVLFCFACAFYAVILEVEHVLFNFKAICDKIKGEDACVKVGKPKAA